MNNLFKDRIVVYPPTVNFNRLAQTPRHILQELSKRGIECYFCDYSQSKQPLKKVSDNLFICYDMEKLSKDLQGKEVIFYNTWPCKYSLKNLFNTVFTIFHYLDNFKSWDKDLANACDSADIILCVTDNLYKKLEGKYKDKLYKFNNACDFHLFHPKTSWNEGKGKVVYYHGCLHKDWVDIELIKKVVSLLPDYQFMFIGDDFSGSKELKNCKIYAHKDIEKLPELLSLADCCIIPFLKNEVSDSADPLKFYEFISQGKPVVVSNIPELEKFKNIIDFANSPEEFAQAIKNAIENDTLEKKIARIEIARQNSWDKRIDYLFDIIDMKILLPDFKGEETIEEDLVSIVLPVYNQGNFLSKAIEGALNQSYKNIELIIVNDGSTDNTREVIEEYRERDSRIKVVHQENKKLPGALNSGFKIASGKYLTWTSADNIQLYKQIETLLDYLKRNPDKGMVFSDYQIICEKGHLLYNSNFRTWNQSKEDTSVIRLPDTVTIKNFHESGDNFIGASFLYRKEIADKVGEYDERFFGAEDLDYWLRMHKITEFGHIKDILYKYRVHPSSLGSRYKELGILDINKVVRGKDMKKRNGKLNIAIQVDKFAIGGMEQQVNNIAKTLNKNKFNITVIITGKDNSNIDPELKKYGVEVIILNNNLKQLETLLQKRHFDIVNPHHSLFGYDIWKKYKTKIIYTIHNIYSWVNSSPEYLKVDLFTAVSLQVKQYFSHRFGISEEKIIEIPNGINPINITEKPFNRQPLNYSKEDYIFINVASITKVKLHHLMLQAISDLVKEYPQFKILFVGSILEPTYYADLIKIIRDKKLHNNVRFLENQTRKQVGGLLQMADCFLMPSLIEGWSNAILEAMWHEKPLILSDIGSAREVIQNNDIGLVIDNPFGNFKNLTPQLHYQYCHDLKSKFPNLFDLKNAMIYMYGNREYFKQQGKLGKIKVNKNHLLQHMIANYEKEFIKNA